MNHLTKVESYCRKKLNYKDLIIFLIPFLVFIYYLYTFDPGILSLDSYNQLHQIATSNFTNWHPFFHTFIEMICIRLYASPISICILQIITFSTIWMVICNYNRNNTDVIDKQFILQIIFTLIISLIPINAIYSITLWKDILFSYFLMLLCFFIEIVLDKKGEISYPFIILLAVTMAIVSQLRPNGIYIIAVMLFILAIYFFKNNETDRFYAILPILTIIFILLIASLNVIYDVEDNQKDAIFAKTEHMLSYYELNNILTQSDKILLYEVINETAIDDNFDITFTDPILWYSNPKIFEIDKSPYNSMAISYSLKNPQIFIGYMFQSAPIVWDIVRDDNWKGFVINTNIESGKNAFFTGDKTPIAPYESLPAKNNGTNGYDSLNGFVKYFTKNKLLSTLFESPALYMYLSIISLILIHLITKSKSIYLIYLPNFLNILIIFVSTPSQDTRYLYPNLLIFYLLIIILIGVIPNLNEKNSYLIKKKVDIKPNKDKKKRKNILNNKKILSIIIIVLLVAVIGFMLYENNSETQHIHVGNANFIIPNGYHEGQLNRLGDINLTNGTHSIFLSANDKNINEQINELKGYFESHNETTITTELNIENEHVYKLKNTNDTFSSFYWFEKDNKVYYIYNWDGIQDMDNIVSNFIKTMQ